MFRSRFELVFFLQDVSIVKTKVSPFSIQTNFALYILEHWHIQSEAGSSRASSSHSDLVHNGQSVRENIPGIGSLSRRNILPRFQSFIFSTARNAFSLGNTVEKVNDWNLGRMFLLERDPIPGMFSLTDWSVWTRPEWEDEEQFEPAKDWFEEFFTRLPEKLTQEA